MSTFMRAPGWRDWTLLAGIGMLVPALITILRVLVLRYTILRELRHGFIPFYGPIDGILPDPIYCLMHNLSHPVVLLLYATVLVLLPLYARGTILNQHRRFALFCGIALSCSCSPIAHLFFCLWAIWWQASEHEGQPRIPEGQIQQRAGTKLQTSKTSNFKA